MTAPTRKIPDRLLPWGFPILIEGCGSLSSLPEYIRCSSQKTMLIITEHSLLGCEPLDQLLTALHRQGITYIIYAGTCSEARTENAEEVAELYGMNGCDGIIAFGGEACLNCSKVAVAMISRPNWRDSGVLRFAARLHIRRRRVSLYAVPTTSGVTSGFSSAMSGTAVVRDYGTQRNISMHDHCLIPETAVLDPALVASL